MDLNWFINNWQYITIALAILGVAYGPKLWAKFKERSGVSTLAPTSETPKVPMVAPTTVGQWSELWATVRKRFVDVGESEAVDAMDKALPQYLVGPPKEINRTIATK